MVVFSGFGLNPKTLKGVWEAYSKVCVCVCVCLAGVCGEQRWANRQARRVPVRSGARWSVSWNDTWQQLAGCALAVLYIHVSADKVSPRWAGQTTELEPSGPPYRTSTGGWEHFLPPVLPFLLCSLSRQLRTIWAGVKVQTAEVPDSDLGLEQETWMLLLLLCNR